MNKTLLDISRQFWEAMEHADEVGMRACAHPDCNFVHIGITCKLDKEIEFYTSGAFQPTNITFHSQKAELFGDTGVVRRERALHGLLGPLAPVLRRDAPHRRPGEGRRFPVRHGSGGHRPGSR